MGYLALAGVPAAWAASQAVRAAGGLSLPLDDAYIYLQYARMAGEGHFLRYQPGAEATRGATSLIYPLVLAPFAAGLYPQGAIWAAWALGWVFLGATAWCAHSWARRCLGPGAGVAAGVLTLASGHLAWGALSGMDIALFAFAIMASLAAAAAYTAVDDRVSGRRRLGVLGAALFLLSLARPEGMVLALLIGAGSAWSGPLRGRLRWLPVIPPLAGIAVTVLVTFAALGHLGSNTLVSKAFWSEQRPDMRALLFARLPRALGEDVWNTFTDLGSRAFGFGTRELLRALFAGGALLGVAAAARRRAPAGLRMLIVVLAAGFLGGLIPFMYNIHYHRYQMPYVPLCLCMAVAGWWWATSRVPRLRPWIAGALVVLLLPGLARMMGAYGRNAGNIQGQHVRMGHWIHDNLPPDAVVAINDAGALAYYGERTVVDMAGLVTNGSALPGRAGPGSLFEWLASLPPERRPTHFAIFPAAFPYLKRTTLVGRKLVDYYLPNVSITGDTRKGLYEADWDAVGWGDLPVDRRPLIDAWGFRVVDSLEVADLADEKRHGYHALGSWQSTLREFTYPQQPGRLLIDGGRTIPEGERFRFACRPGQPAALVLRTEAFLPFTVEVSADGTPVGRFEVPAAPTLWSEPLFELPGDALTAASVEITVRLVDGDRYSSYRYWLLQ